ncbi:transcriptional regulator with XRE-family HTH domain [Bradyrhizobium sp. USDA 4503]
MKLSDWIAREGLSHQEVGDRIGKSQAAVSRYAAGKRMPDEETLIKIFEVTAGEVTPNDFVDLPVIEQERESEADAGAVEG